MLARHKKGMLTALCATAVIGPTNASMACHEDREQLKLEFSRCEDQLNYSYRTERNALLFAHKAALEDVRYARKQAQQLCGPQKAAALREIDHHRRSVVNRHAQRMRALKVDYCAAQDALDAEYRLRLKSLKCTCRASQLIVAAPPVPPMVHGSSMIRLRAQTTAAGMPGPYGPVYEMQRTNEIPPRSTTDRYHRTTALTDALATMFRMYSSESSAR